MKVRKADLVATMISMAMPTTAQLYAPVRYDAPGYNMPAIEYKMQSNMSRPKFYLDATSSPELWQMMTPKEWDKISFPARLHAYDQMRRYWIDHYHKGKEHISKEKLNDVLRAIAHVESGNDHKAVSALGAMGLYQLLLSTRNDLRNSYQKGEFGININDDSKFFDPFINTSAAVYEFKKRLHRNRGNVSRTIQSWAVGQAKAHRGSIAAELYEEEVNKKRKILD